MCFVRFTWTPCIPYWNTFDKKRKKKKGKTGIHISIDSLEKEFLEIPFEYSTRHIIWLLSGKKKEKICWSIFLIDSMYRLRNWIGITTLECRVPYENESFTKRFYTQGERSDTYMYVYSRLDTQWTQVTSVSLSQPLLSWTNMARPVDRSTVDACLLIPRGLNYLHNCVDTPTFTVDLGNMLKARYKVTFIHYVYKCNRCPLLQYFSYFFFFSNSIFKLHESFFNI